VPVNVRHEIHHAALFALLHSPTGGVAKDMLRRGIRVQSQAKRNLGGGAGRPRRIDTGLLRNSVYVRPVVVAGAPAARVGTVVRYARWVHDGTGVYGPRRSRIRPRHGRFLVFTPKGSPRRVFVRSVKGMRPNRFLADALSAAKR
jgi:hypothetical protein